MALNLTNWVDKVIKMDTFAEYERKSMKSMKKGYETGFTVQICADEGVYYSELSQGNDSGVIRKYYPTTGDRFLGVHYHPNGYPAPSKTDLKNTEKDAIRLRKFIGSPPADMIGAKNSGKLLYVVIQRRDFPNIIEEGLLRLFDWAYLDTWKPLRLKRYRKELTERVNSELKNSGIDDNFKYRGDTIITNDGLKNVIKSIGHEKVAIIAAESLENNFDFKTGVVETYKGTPTWLYGSPEQFD